MMDLLQLKNHLSVKNGRTKEIIVYDDGDNAKEKGGTKTSDKASNFTNSDKEVATNDEPWATYANISLKDIGCLKPPNS